MAVGTRPTAVNPVTGTLSYPAAATVGPNFPVIASGRWHADGQGSGAQSSTLIADRAYFVPIWPGRVVTLTGLSINIGAAFTTPGNVRAGLCTANPSTHYPDALLADFGVVTATAATREWLSLTAAMEAVLHFAVLTPQGGSGGTPTWSARNIHSPLVFEASASGINPNTNRTAYYKDGISGAYPASFSTPDGTIVGPSVACRFG